MLRLQHLTLGWEPDKPVLRHISFDFAVPGVYAIMGSSGLGKTTLLKAMAGRLAPQAGSIQGFDGAKRGLLFQENRLLPWCSVLKNVSLAMPQEDREKAKTLLHALGIEEVEALPGSFSGGMQRRVALARAMAYGAPYLLLDEPFTGMDWPLKQHVAPLLLASAPFILFSTHELEEVSLMKAQLLSLHADRLEKA